MGDETKPTVKRPHSEREVPGDGGEPMRCSPPKPADLAGVTVIELSPTQPVADYRAAMGLANAEAAARLGEHMLLSWFDRDRGFESPPHAGECHRDSAVPGYVDYGVHHGATLKVDVAHGRFVFFYLPVDL